MKLNKSIILIFSICTVLLLSLCAVSASDMSKGNITSSSAVEGIVISEDLDDVSISNVENMDNADDVISEEISDSSSDDDINLDDGFSIGYDSSLNNEVNEKSFDKSNVKGSNVLADGDAHVCDEFIIKNPSFNDSINFWDTYGEFAGRTATSSQSHDEGNKSIAFIASSISQVIDFTVVDSLNFYVITNGAPITVVIGDDFTQMYHFDGEEANNWNLISIDTSDITGFKVFSITNAIYTTVLVDDFFVTINNLNHANFTGKIINQGDDNYTVEFTDGSYGLISTWLWDFGDGFTSTERNPIHTFKNGVYPTASLTVSSDSCTDTYSLNLYGPVIERSGETFTTIQDAIDGAIENDTIIVNSYLNLEYYSEDLILNKSVTLIFNNVTLLNKTSSLSFTVTKGADAKIKNLSLKDLSIVINGEDDSYLGIIDSSISNSSIDIGANVKFINSTIDKNSGINVNEGSLSLNDSNLKNIILDSNNSSILLDNVVLKDFSNITLSNGEIKLYRSSFDNSKFDIFNSSFDINDLLILNYFTNDRKIKYDFIIANSSGTLNNISLNKLSSDHVYGSLGFKFVNSNASFVNSNLSKSAVAINQTGGELNISNNLIHDNDIGIKVLSGMSNIHYNAIHSNSNVGLVYSGDSVDYSNNWWGTNDPSFNASASIPSDYYDIVYIGEGELGNIYPYLLLNLSSSSNLLSVNSNCVIHVDLTYNSDGERTVDDSNIESIISSTIPDMLIGFESNKGTCGECSIVNGQGEFVFTSSNQSASQVTFTSLNQKYNLSLLIDSTVPKITYITPSVVFNDTLLVDILCDTPDAVIYYTLDGSDPKISETRIVYVNPFEIDKSTTVHATAMDEAGNYARLDYVDAPDVSVTYLKSSDLDDGDSGAIWGEYQGNRNNTGVSNQSGPLTNISKWSRLDIASDASVLVDKNGLIYVAGEDGYLYCLNSEGKTVWAYGTRSKIISTPAIGSNGHIYFTNWENSTLYELDDDGYLVWKYELGDYCLGSSIKFGPDGTLYAISGNDSFAKVFAFKDQTLRWICELPVSSSGSTPTIAEDGTLYLVLKDSSIALINWDGTVKGYIKPFGIVNESASVSIGPNGLVYVLKTSTRSNAASTALDIYYLNGSALVCDNRKLVRNQYVFGAPAIYEDKVFLLALETIWAGTKVNGYQGKLYAFNGTSGNLLWRVNVSNADFSASSPIVSADGIIYVASNFTVYAFDMDGNEIWSYELRGEYGNPAVLSGLTLTEDGTLIVPSTQGIFTFNDLSAEFTWEYANGTERGIQFRSIATEGNNTYYWRFGDYRYSKLENPVHEYFRPGNYTVYLTVNHSGVLLGCNKTIEVVDHDITPPEDIVASIDGKIAFDAEYRGSQNVTLSSSDNWGEYTIYYTVDGSNPLNSSTRREYYEPVLVETDTFLQFVAVDPAGNYGNVGNLTLNISDAILVNETLVEKIQKMLDEAEPNSKIVINYAKIAGANFTVNKPLNIISTNNTLLVGNGVDPVFTITPNASGTKINGFALENSVDTVLLNQTSDVSILNTVAYSIRGTGFNIVNSNNTLIKDSTSNNSYHGIKVNGSSNTVLNHVNVTGSKGNGVSVNKSSNTIINNSFIDNNGKKESAANVLLDDSNKTSIINTIIKRGFFGIRFNNTNKNVDIINNTINNTAGDAILFEGATSRTNVTLNTIEGSFNGLNFNGYANKIYVTNNLVWKMHDQSGDIEKTGNWNVYNPRPWSDTYGQFHNCVQISAGSSNFGDGVYMENNIFIKQQHRSWESRHSSDVTTPSVTDWEETQLLDSCVGHDYNLWDGSGSYDNSGGAVGFSEGRVNLVVDRIGDSTFRLRLKNMRTGEYLTDIDPFDVTVTAGSLTKVIKFDNDSAIATFNTASTITKVKFTISMHISKSISWDVPITEGYNSSIKDKDPGRVEGDAYDNKHPVVPPMYEEDEEPVVPIDDNGNNSGESGSGNGSGSGHGTGLGNGTGSGMGEGQNSGNGTGRANVKAGDENMPGGSSDVSAVFSQSQSTGGDADSTTNPNAGGSGRAYEIDEKDDVVSKSISLDDPMKLGLLILLSIFLAIGYYIARENEWMK